MTIIPEEETPDLFEPAPGPAPVQYDLFTEEDGTEELQQVTPASAQCPAPFTGCRRAG